jgi:hypothetical protein
MKIKKILYKQIYKYWDNLIKLDKEHREKIIISNQRHLNYYV